MGGRGGRGDQARLGLRASGGSGWGEVDVAQPGLECKRAMEPSLKSLLGFGAYVLTSIGILSMSKHSGLYMTWYSFTIPVRKLASHKAASIIG